MDEDIFNEEIAQSVQVQDELKEQGSTQESAIRAQSKTQPSQNQEARLPPEQNESDDDSVKLSKQEYESFRKMQHESELARVDREFKKEYPDFDIKKVTDKILDLDEKNPGIGQRLLSHEGIENVYLKYFAGKSEAVDEFDSSRGLGGGVNIDERIMDINAGRASEEEILELYSKFL